MMPNIFGTEPGAMPLELMLQAFSLKLFGGFPGAFLGLSWDFPGIFLGRCPKI